MEIFVLLLMVAAFAAYQLKSKTQKKRITLLASHLGRYQVEKLMESLTEGYLRALGEKDAERQVQIWNMLAVSEEQLVDQFRRFAADFSAVDVADARVSKLPVFLPETDRFFPDNTFDMRKMLAVHAEGIARAVNNEKGRQARDKAYTLSAELFLMQHSCHWYCRSKAIASARMLARHQTPYQQLLASVDPQTREAYLAVIGR
ncbi:MAG: hypothetical protein H0W47_05880 [Polaromonas sp.]|uniref:hypothetical protein n=1 Tax=Polaromonas sp. TaxID=1869339 RepID=UPI0017DD1117|nr:hypothetical protein [Polaromonas sp.]MBA3593312.1 hypothetical protein [Polaromonas sp.]